MDLDVDRPKRSLRRLLVKDLQDVLRAEGMPVSGTKGLLQRRIIERLEYYASSRDSTNLARLCVLIDPSFIGDSNDYGGGSLSNSSAYSQPSPSYHKHHQAYPQNYASGSHTSSFMPSFPQATKLRFADDPFHKIVESRSQQLDMPPMMSNRHTVSTRLTLNEPLASDLQARSSNLRIAVYCGNDFRAPAAHIAFPQQCEIKVNGETFSGNLRGLKKKAGTTHPADITHLLRKRPPTYSNEITVTYAATDKKFAFVLNLIQYTSPEELVAQVRRERHVPKDTVLREMQKEANDPDIVAGPRVMSLSCPVGGGRIKTPIRSTSCMHNQCFDALNFFLAQLQAPQWECPVCYKTSHLSRLAVDEYFLDILTRTVQTQAFNVTVHPDGRWEDKTPVKPAPERPKKKIQAISLDESEDDDDEYGEDGDVIVKSEPLHSPTGPATTQFEPSSTPATGSKRPAEVIDLTLSDDDGPPPRPAKQLSTGSNSHRSSSNGTYRGYEYPDRGSSLDRRSGNLGLPTRIHSSSLQPAVEGGDPRHDQSLSSLPTYNNNTGNSLSTWPALGWGSEEYEYPAYR